MRRGAWWVFLGLAAAASVAAISAYRVPELVGTAMAEAVGEAGFKVRRWEIRGIERMSRLPIDEAVSGERGRAMPLVDLEETRRRLLRFGWIEEARVSRRLPDTLVIDIIERKPAAIWQHERRLVLIDREGVELEPVRLDAMPDLPLVIGPRANVQTGALSRLLDSVPHLRPQLGGATWIGGRRWDLRFQSGETLSLPEGEEEALGALRNFARMDRQNNLLGRGFVRFDMRIPGRFIVRVSREPGSAVPAIAPEVPPAGAPDDLANTI
jgi:cell division protein FtsQ